MKKGGSLGQVLKPEDRQKLELRGVLSWLNKNWIPG